MDKINLYINALDLDGSAWNPQLFCGPAAIVVQGRNNKNQIVRYAECIEGQRATESSKSQDEPFYSQSNIEPMRFELTLGHWNPPKEDTIYSIQPGDVVINKHPEIRAARATESVYRHPIDSNCILIRGLNQTWGFWIAFCLNHVAYTSYLLLQSGSSILPRVSLKALRKMPVLPPPGEAEVLGRYFDLWHERYLKNSLDLNQLRESVRTSTEKFDNGDWPKPNLKEGYWFTQEEIEDSLLPKHVELSSKQYRFSQDNNWVCLKDVIGESYASRLKIAPQKGRFIRLSDSDRDLGVVWPKPESKSDQPALNHIYQEPLQSKEVLLSILVSDSKVAFIDDVPDQNTYVTDHWMRLNFYDTPAAWAMILEIPTVKTQIEQMASGSAQQFTTIKKLENLYLPNIPKEDRQNWANIISKHHETKRKLMAEWVDLWDEALNIFNLAHTQTGGRNP